ncbi:GNAT family N-acetyltransferase [Nocardia goodfellowii]
MPVNRALPEGFTLVEGIPDEHYREWLDCWLAGQHATPLNDDPSELEFYRRTFAPERGLAIRDDRGYVATNTTLDAELVMPGGRTVPAAVGTAGFCHPTLTRKGLTRALLERLDRRAAAEGKALIADWPTEWPIYQRFGHGPAAWHDSAVIDVKRAGLRDDVPGAGVRPRRVHGSEARDVARQVFDTRAASTPGEIIPPAGFWDRLALDPTSPDLDGLCTLSGANGGPRQCAAIDGRGFVSYRIMPRWTSGQAPDSVLHVVDFLAADSESAGALWRHLFSIDLVGEIRVPRLPVDDPLRWWVVDARHLRCHRQDSLWLRLIDVAACLAARQWSADGALTLRVHDAHEWGAGTYRLEADAGVGRCRRTAAEPDLELDVSALGTILLGGSSAASLYRSGRIAANDPASVRLWDVMATPQRAPFLSYVL